MQLNLNEFIDEQRKGLTELPANLSKSRVAAAPRKARAKAKKPTSRARAKRVARKTARR